MSTSRTTHLPRRVLLGVPALVVAAVTLVARPSRANAKPQAECAADLLGAS